MKLKMEKITIIMSSVLPIPATKGGAVENLLENIAKEQEKENKIDLNIISAYDYEAEKKSKSYKNTKFYFLRVSRFSKFLDKIVLFLAKNIFKKHNLMAYSFIFQRVEYYRKISKLLSNDDFGKLVLENSAGLYLALKWRKNYLKYKDRYYYHCHNSVKIDYGCGSIIKDTRKFIGVSNYIIRDLEKNLGRYVSAKSEVLRNCIDESKFVVPVSDDEKLKLRLNYNINKEDKVVLFTGRLTEEKGIMELMQAIDKCNTNNIKLLVVGSFFFNTNVKSKFEEKLSYYKEKLNDKVVFTGFVNYDEIYKFYKIADIAVLPSIWDDPAPLTIIECLVSCLPIITTDSGGIPEYATNGSAIILNRDDILLKALQTQLTNF